MAGPISSKALSYLSILAYAKTLPDYSKHKPVLTINQDVYPEYFDYFIGSEGLLYIIMIQPDGLVATNSKFEVVIVDPESIQSVNFDIALGMDVTKAPAIKVSGTSASEFFRSVFSNCKSGANNYGVPYSRLKLSAQSDWFYLDRPVFVDASSIYFVLRADAISLPLKSAVQQDILLFYDDVISVSIPLLDLPAVFGSLAALPSEITTARNNLLKTYNLSDTMFPQWMPSDQRRYNNLPPYIQGEKVRRGNDSYISRIDNNTFVPGMPGSENAWIKI